MKIALIYAFEESYWFSCTKIVKNLISSYELACADYELIKMNYNFDDKDFSLIGLVDELTSKRPDKIVVLDHRPHPITFIQALKRKSNDYNPDYYFHVYGDFTLHFPEWSVMGDLLNSKKVHFFCASDAQLELVSNCVKEDGVLISKIPFPVETKEFKFNKQQKKRLADQFDLDEKGLTFLYTGRFSSQKKIIELIETFSNAILTKKIEANSYLLLAGSFDSIGFVFGGIYEAEGEFFRKYDRCINKLPEEVRKQIKVLGLIDNKKLKEIYNDVDYFVSLSTYHDEDYGMSIAEAGISGVPLLLSNWAGFKSFSLGDSTKYVETYLGDKYPLLCEESSAELMNNLEVFSEEKRKEISLNFEKYCSVENIAELLKEKLNLEIPNFKGFNEFHAMLSRTSSLGLQLFYDEYEKKLNSNYKKLYGVYASKN